MTWDVLIAGSGPAGSVAALVLARSGYQVLLVDNIKPGIRKLGESLPSAARPLLRTLDLLGCIEKGGHLPCYGNVSAWGSHQLIGTDFIRNPQGTGWHLDRTKFDADLRAAALNAGAIWQSDQVRKITATTSDWLIHFIHGQTKARWLIDATGRRAIVARSQGIRRYCDDRLVALYTWTTPLTEEADSRTLVESAPYGWWYTAKLPDLSRVVVLHVDAEEAASIRQAPETWKEYLASTKHISHLLAGATLTANICVTEASGARLECFSGHGWLATGDAALSFDPLSSQGIFNALYTGMKVGETLQAALTGKIDAIQTYTVQLESIRQAYLHHYWLIYQNERRWINRPFWLKRQLKPNGLKVIEGIT